MKYVKTSFVVMLFFCANMMMAQTEGVVTDAMTNAPLPDVYVKAEGRILAVTDTEGRFVLDSVHDTFLTFHHIGYETDTLSITAGHGILKVSLEAEPHYLPETGISAPKQSYKPRPAFSLRLDSIDALSMTASPVMQMNLAPPVNFSRGARNTQKMTIRGIGSRGQYATTRVKPFLNGIPLASSTGEMFLDDLLYGRLGLIEVVPGPTATPFGSSSGGLLIMQSKIPQGKGEQISSGAVMGQDGYFHQFNSMGFSEENITGNMHFLWLNDNGFRANDSYKGADYSSIFRLKLSEKTVLQSFTSYTRFKAYIPSSLSEQDFRHHPEKAAQSWLEVEGYEQDKTLIQGLSLEHEYNSRFSNSTTLFAIGYNGKERRPFNVLQDKAGSVGFRTVFEQRKVANMEGLNAKAGISYQHDSYQWKTFETLPDDSEGEKLSAQEQIRHDGGAFLFGSYRGRGFIATGGVYAGKTAYNTSNVLEKKENSEYDPGIAVSPSLRFGFFLGSSSEVFFALSRGFSAPSYEEAIDSEGTINESLLPEHGWLRELGFRYRDISERLQGQTSIFYTTINNQIVTKRLTEDRFVKRNAGKTDYLGVEHWMKYSLVEKTEWRINVSLSYTYSDFSFLRFMDDGMDYTGNTLPGIPEHKGGARIEVRIAEAFRLNSDIFVSGKVAMNDANTRYYKGYTLMNLKASYEKALSGRTKINIFAMVENFTDEKYAAMLLVNAPSYGGAAPRYYYPGLPRSFRFGIELNYLPDIL